MCCQTFYLIISVPRTKKVENHCPRGLQVFWKVNCEILVKTSLKGRISLNNTELSRTQCSNFSVSKTTLSYLKIGPKIWEISADPHFLSAYQWYKKTWHKNHTSTLSLKFPLSFNLAKKCQNAAKFVKLFEPNLKQLNVFII